MNRRKLSMKDKLEILIRQSVCPLCGERLGKLEDVDFDHEQALARGGDDTNDNLRGVHRSCHRKKTSGTKATSTGSDIHEIAKTKRLTKDHNEFVSRLLSRECGEKREKTGKIKSRGFEKRKKG
jgi:5-methylcytosine-specific restriction endonuclease McrA